MHATREVLPAVSSPAVSNDVQWYAIQVRYRYEKKVLQHLSAKGLETFSPMIEQVHRWSDRRKTISMPLFSGYGFVQMALSQVARMRVLQTEGVIGFVTIRGEAVPIPARQIESLRLLLSQKLPCAIHAFVKSGQRVRIRGGCLDGVEGIYQRSQENSMIICVEAIQRAVSIRIEGYELEML